MKVAPKKHKLHFSDLQYNTFIYAYMPNLYMLQLIDILPSVTNGP